MLIANLYFILHSLSKFASHRFNQFLIFDIRQIHLSRIHLESTTIIGTIYIFRRQMKMKMSNLSEYAP